MNFSVNEVSFPYNDTISWYRKDQGSAQVLTLIKISNVAVGQRNKSLLWKIHEKKWKGGGSGNQTLIKCLLFIIHSYWIQWHHCKFAGSRELENNTIFTEWF